RAPATGPNRRRRWRSTRRCWARWHTSTDPSRRLAERPHERTPPPDVGDLRARWPVGVAAVGPPLERVEVVATRLDDLRQWRPAPPHQPHDGAGRAADQHPAAVEQRVRRAEPAALPDVHVLVVGDDAPATGIGRGDGAGAVDGVADGDEEAAAD